MATSDGAKVLGLDDLVGTIKKGMKADIVIVNLNKPHLTPLYDEYSHLVYAVNGADADTVLINGRIVMKDRRLLTINEAEVMERVNRIAIRIRDSLKS
jgi:5-methylthioadenosine/S-adenosylhomocysteine deaminase